ncbi:MAG: bile acid:sodium symporter family protein [Nitrososphaerales archaeon]
MTAVEFVGLVAQLSGLLFVVTSMLAMGMSLTVHQIIQPLKNPRLVILALLANFVLVPLLAFVLTAIIPLEESLRVGLIVLATAAGAPFLPKLVQGAKGNLAFGVGLMVLLMVITVFYMPLVLPLLLPGVSVDPWAIAQSLIVSMLIPLAIGLLIRSHSPDVAAHWQQVLSKIASLAILVLLVTGIGLNVSNILALIGSFGFLVLLLFIVGSLLIGYLLGGRDPSVRSVLGLGTAQRNVAAAILVTAQNFGGTNTLSFVLVAAILLLLILLPIAKRLGARADVPASAPVPTGK